MVQRAHKAYHELTNEMHALEEDTEPADLMRRLVKDLSSQTALVGELVKALTQMDQCGQGHFRFLSCDCRHQAMRAIHQAPAAALAEREKAQKVIEAADALGARLGTKDHPAQVWYADELEALDCALSDLKDLRTPSRVEGGERKHPRRGTNAGHGHVWERPDGLKARCGGPAMCAECARDAAQPSTSGEDAGG